MAPMVSYFIMLLWTVLFGNTVDYFAPELMLDEWLLSIIIYAIIITTVEVRKKNNEKQ